LFKGINGIHGFGDFITSNYALNSDTILHKKNAIFCCH